MAKRSSPEQLSAFGRRLRDLREELGLSQQEVADRLGITDVGYGGFERGQRMPSADLLPWLAGGLGVSTEELVIRLGLVDQKILDGSVPEAIAGRLTRIVANYGLLDKVGKEHIDAILGLASDFGRSDSATTPHPDSQADPHHNDDKVETNFCREFDMSSRTTRELALA